MAKEEEVRGKKVSHVATYQPAEPWHRSRVHVRSWLHETTGQVTPLARCAQSVADGGPVARGARLCPTPTISKPSSSRECAAWCTSDVCVRVERHITPSRLLGSGGEWKETTTACLSIHVPITIQRSRHSPTFASLTTNTENSRCALPDPVTNLHSRDIIFLVTQPSPDYEYKT